MDRYLKQDYVRASCWCTCVRLTSRDVLVWRIVPGVSLNNTDAIVSICLGFLFAHTYHFWNHRLRIGCIICTYYKGPGIARSRECAVEQDSWKGRRIKFEWKYLIKKVVMNMPSMPAEALHPELRSPEGFNALYMTLMAYSSQLDWVQIPHLQLCSTQQNQ